MREMFQSYFKQLEKVSTKELHLRAENIVKAEKKHIADLIAHICEISRRKAHIELGYTSL